MSDTSPSPGPLLDRWLNQLAFGIVGSVAVAFALAGHSFRPALAVVSWAAISWLLLEGLLGCVMRVKRAVMERKGHWSAVSSPAHCLTRNALLPIAMMALTAVASVWTLSREIDAAQYDALATAMPAASEATRALVVQDLITGNGQITKWRYQALVDVVMNDVGWLRYQQEGTVAELPTQRARLKALAEQGPSK